MKIAAFALAFAAMTASARETTTEVGSWEADRENGVRASVFKTDNYTNIILFVHDRHVINTVYMRVSVAEAKELRKLLDETIAEAEGQGVK